MNIRITDPFRAKRAVGWPLAGRFSTDLPVTAPVEFVAPDADVSPAPAAPPELVAWLESRLPRYPVGAYVLDEERIARRRAALPAWRNDRAWYRLARDAYALPAEELPSSPIADAVFAEPDALYPWDCEGKRLDAEHERAMADAARAKAAAEERARLAAMPNTRTLDELGLIGVRPHGKGAAVIVFEKPIDRRLSWVSSVQSFGTVLDGGAVLAKVPEARRITDPGDIARWMSLRGATEDPVEATRDGRTPDGEFAETLFRERLEACARDVLALPDVLPEPSRHKDGDLRVSLRDARVWKKYAVQVAARGLGLARELTWSVVVDVLTQVWSAAFPPMPGEPAHSALVDPVTGQEISRDRARSLEQHAAARGVDGPRFVERIIPATTIPTPPLPFTRSEFDALYVEALSGRGAWFSPDELFTPPPATFVARFKSFFNGDRDWQKVIDRVTDGKDAVSTTELEAEIVRAGLCDAFGPEEHKRLARLMSGWTRKRSMVQGDRASRFVRGAA